MKIMGLIEAARLPTPVIETAKRMQASLEGSEVVVIEFNKVEIQAMRLDFMRLVKNHKWKASDQETTEKAELMHMVGIALKNSNKANCSWFKDSAMKIHQDAGEFDRNSRKTVMTSKGILFLILVYNGRWVGGKENSDDGIIRDEPNGPMDGAGEDLLQ